MTTVMLWLASFTLHGILIYSVLILSTRLKAMRETETKQRQLLEETENTLAAFLMEIKDENRALMKEIGVSEDESTQNTDGRDQLPMIQKSEMTGEFPSHLESLLKETEKKEEVFSQADQKETHQQTFEEQVVSLAKKGYSIEGIARKLKIGKTEIELLLKFRGLN